MSTPVQPGGAVAAAPAPAPSSSTVIKLSKSITTHAGAVSQLTLREPNAGDFIDLNDVPFEIRGSGENAIVKVNWALGAKWLGRLAGIDEIEIKQMNRRDFIAAIGLVNEVLVQDGAAGNA